MRHIVTWALGIAVVFFAGSVAWRFLRPRRGQLPAPTHIRIDVVNGCGVPRAGRDVMREMLAAGFNVYAVRNSARHWERTTVLDRLDHEGRNARIVAEALAVPRCFLGIDIGLRVKPECRVEIDSARYVDAEVVVGSDYQLFFPGARPAH